MEATTELFMQLSEGNPGALTVLVEFTKVDPENFAPFALWCLATGIKGPFLWVAFSDLHAKNIHSMIADWMADTLEEKVKATHEWKYYHPNE